MKPTACCCLVLFTLLCLVKCQWVHFVENDVDLKNVSTNGLMTSDSGWSPDDGGQRSEVVQFLPIPAPVFEARATQTSQNGRRTQRQAFSGNSFNTGSAWSHKFSLSSVHTVPQESAYLWGEILNRLKTILEKETNFDFLNPKGLRISISASNTNMRIEDFRLKLNEEFRDNDGGHYAPSVYKRDGNWSYDLPQLKVQQGDKVYYLMIVTFIREGIAINVNGVVEITRGNPHSAGTISFRPSSVGPLPQPSYGGGSNPTFGGGLGGGMTGSFSWAQRFDINRDYGSGYTQNSDNTWQQQAALLKQIMEKIEFKFPRPLGTGLTIVIPDNNINMKIVDFRLKKNEEFGNNDGGHYAPDAYKRGGNTTYSVPQLSLNAGDRVHFFMRVKLGKEELDTIVKGVMTISQGDHTAPSTPPGSQPNTGSSAGGQQGGSASWYHTFNLATTHSAPFAIQESSNSWMTEAELFKATLKDIKFQFHKPTGLSISIAGDSENVKILAFNVKLNEAFRVPGPGQFVGNGTQLADGRWYYYYPNLKLNQGDKLYYWMRVILGKQAFDTTVKGEVEVTRGDPHLLGPIADQILSIPYPSQPPPTPKPPQPPSYPYPTPPISKPNPLQPPSYPYPTPPVSKPNPPQPPPFNILQTTIDCQHSRSSAKIDGVTSSPCQGSVMYQFSSLDGWTHQISIGGTNTEDEFTIFTKNEKNIWVQQGRLTIKPTLLRERFSDKYVGNGLLELTGCTLFHLGSIYCRRQASGFNILNPVESARVSTRTSFTFRYGTVEIRAKLPRGDWIVPELWLEPTDSAVKEKIILGIATGNSGETSKRLAAGVVMANDLSPIVLSTMGSTPWYQGFHTFKLEWTPEQAKFFVDGRLIGELPTSSFSVFRQEVCISLGIHVAGISDFPDDLYPNKPWNNTNVKRVARFWERRTDWFPTWKNPTLEVEYIKVTAL